MSNHEFILKSGARLHITTAPFESAIGLVEAVKRASVGRDPNMDIGEIVLTSADVRKALYPVFDTVLYETFRVGPGLFDDPKIGERARGDYFEICGRVIEVNSKPFFLTNFSSSTTPPVQTSKSPE